LVQSVTSNIYDIQVVVTFSDDTVDPPRTVRAMYRTAVFRGS
jgi:hypothetical protein